MRTPQVPFVLAGCVLTCLVLLPMQVQAQDSSDRFMLEAGIVGGNSIACPGHFAGLSGRVAGPFSLYGMVEHYRCLNVVGSANRIGGSIRLGRNNWLIRPALRAGMEYDGGSVSPTAGASLTFGRSYGARLTVQVGEASNGTNIVLLQLSGYFTF